MSVNLMDFEDAAAVLTSIHDQATGETSITPTSLEDFVSMAQATLRVGVDPVLKAISQVLTKTIISVRPYSRKFAGLEMTGDQWGAVVRKINFVENDPESDPAYTIANGQQSGIYPVKLPKVIETHYYGRDVYCDVYTITEQQVKASFAGFGPFNTFWAGLMDHFSNQREQWLENLTRAAVANFITAKYVADGGTGDMVVHLLTEYNTLTGLTLTSTTVYQPANFTPFIRWMYGRLNTLARAMSERSEKFQQKLTAGHIMRHTPARDLKAYILASFKDQIDSQAKASTYNDDYLKAADMEGVSFWQSIESPAAIQNTPAYIDATGAIATATAQSLDNVIGVFFDRDAIGYNIYDDSIEASTMDVYKRCYTIVPHTEIQLQNDITEKGVVLILD